MKRLSPGGRLTPRQYFNDLIAQHAFLDGQGPVVHRPVEVFMQVASGCNLDCYMCYEHNRPPELRRGRGLLSMSPELYAKIVEQVYPYSRKVTFGMGGEPMLSEHLADFIETAWKHDQHVHLMTNGTRITADRTAEILTRCLSSMEISIDASTAETYERIRLGSRWNQLRKNLERLNRYRDRSAPEQRLHLTLCFVMMRSNIDELPGFIDFAAEMGADKVHAHHVIPVNEEGRADSLWGDEARSDRYRAGALKRGRALGIEVEVPEPFGPNGAPDPSAAQEHPTDGSMHISDGMGASVSAPQAPVAVQSGGCVSCHMPTLTVFLCYDGRVYPCCHPYAQVEEPMGDLSKQSFDDIWNGRAYRNLRVGLASEDPPPLCKVCSIINRVPRPGELPDEQRANLASYYGDRDLGPIPAAGLPDTLAVFEKSGVPEHLATLLGHIKTLEDERPHLLGHIKNIEEQRVHDVGRLADLERERPHLVGHIENLERIVSKTKAKEIYRFLGGIKGLVSKKSPRAPN